MISRFFIDRPIFACVLSIVITLAGGISVFTLPLAQFPAISPPTVAVTCAYPGTSARRGHFGRRADRGASQRRRGHALHVLELHERRLLQHVRHVQARHQSQHGPGARAKSSEPAQPKLPQVIKQTGVTVRKKSPDALVGIAVTSPSKRYDQLYLSNYVLTRIKDELGRVPGVSDVVMNGQRDYSIRIWVDPHKLASRNMTASDVVTAIRDQNAPVATGMIGNPPMRGDQTFEITTSTLGRLAKLEDFEDIVLKTTDEGRLVRVKDVGHVELGAKNQDVSVVFDGKPTVLIAGLSVARRQCTGHARPGVGQDGGPGSGLSGRNRVGNQLRYHALHPRIDQRGVQGSARRRDSRRHRRARILAELALGSDPVGRGARGHRGHVRGHGRVRFQPQQFDPFRPGAGDRYRRRRRDRGGRSRGTQHRAGVHAARRHDPGHGPGVGPRDRRRAGAQRRVRAVRVYQRHHGAILSTVRADNFGVHDHFRVQLVDAQPRADRAAAATARRMRGRPFPGPHFRWPAAGPGGRCWLRVGPIGPRREPRSKRRCPGPWHARRNCRRDRQLAVEQDLELGVLGVQLRLRNARRPSTPGPSACCYMPACWCWPVMWVCWR